MSRLWRSPAAPKTRRPRRFWTSALPALVSHLTRTTPWATLFAGCASGTLVLAVLAHFAGRSPLDQSTVRVTFLPAVAALAFVPHTHFRPVTQATPVPTWIAVAGQTLLALPVLTVTCWAQLQLMASTKPAGAIGSPPAVYPLLAQLTGWSLLTLAIAACCERTRYAALSGAIAVPVSATLIAGAEFTPVLQRHLLTPPATPHAATIAWCAVAAVALALTGVASRDQWHRYARKIHQ
jgi:hypothetical protein